MADPDDIRRLAEFVRANVDFRRDLGRDYGYAHLPMCVIDAIFSIGVGYGSVKAVVARYAAWADLAQFRLDAADDHQQTISEFCDLIEPLGPERFAEVVNNRCRTSTTNGILKADAVARFATVLRDHGIEDFADVPTAIKDSDLDKALRSVKGQGSGISTKYFFMLAGDDTTVKPDRMLVRFCTRALERKVTPTEAGTLVIAAAGALSEPAMTVTPRDLDHAIWSWQRSR